MADRISKEQRSNNMKAIRAVSKLEDRVSKALWNKGLRMRRNVRSLFGNPDFAIKKYKVVIFIDSCFWHCCPQHGNKPKNNSEFWDKKLKRNITRDIEVTNYYKKAEWKIMRIWEHDLKNNFDKTIIEIFDFVQKAKNNDLH